MRQVLGILAFLLILLPAIAQKTGQRDFELGVSAGVSWYNGDLNPNVLFGRDYMHRAIGVHLRKNLNQRFALRGQFTYGTLSADDRLSSSTFQQNRNLNFTTDLYEFAGTIEFNFLPYDALDSRHPFSPYTFIGLSLFRFNPETDLEGNVYQLQPLATENKQYSRTSVALPFGFGFKLALTDRFILSADWGMRRTFTDYLDDVSTKYPPQGTLEGLSEDISDRSLEQASPDGTNWGTQRGNSKTKDWYSITMVSLSIRIGPKKGSCKHIRI